MALKFCISCPNTVEFNGGRPTLRCAACREAHKREYNRAYWHKRGSYEPDLTTAEIEAKLAAGDAERKRTRARLA